MKIVDGGFKINAEYSRAYLYELAKMDGAIVLSEDSKRILLANTQLIPNYNIPTTETGTRHRTAERVARQTGAIVISFLLEARVAFTATVQLSFWKTVVFNLISKPLFKIEPGQPGIIQKKRDFSALLSSPLPAHLPNW